MKRRNFLKFGTLLMSVAPFSLGRSAQAAGAAGGAFEVNLTSAEWRAKLGKDAFYVLREAGTERPYSSPLNDEKRKGVFQCKGCAQPVYSSETKFDSGTGWPSFYEALDGAVATKADRSLFFSRTEVHCDRCGGHLGHVFDDGPAPTGKRHCINGVAMIFVPASA